MPSTNNTTSFYEPHPSTNGRAGDAHHVVYGSARGGAGNYAKYPRSAISSGAFVAHEVIRPREASTASVASRKNGYVVSGIGGAGNAHRGQAQQYDFDAELERIQRHAERSVANDHVILVGRGGAGNKVVKGRSGSDSSVSSSSSAGSFRRGLKNMLGRHGN